MGLFLLRVCVGGCEGGGEGRALGVVRDVVAATVEVLVEGDVEEVVVFWRYIGWTPGYSHCDGA